MELNMRLFWNRFKLVKTFGRTNCTIEVFSSVSAIAEFQSKEQYFEGICRYLLLIDDSTKEVNVFDEWSRFVSDALDTYTLIIKPFNYQTFIPYMADNSYCIHDNYGTEGCIAFNTYTPPWDEYITGVQQVAQSAGHTCININYKHELNTSFKDII